MAVWYEATYDGVADTEIDSYTSDSGHGHVNVTRTHRLSGSGSIRSSAVGGAATTGAAEHYIDLTPPSQDYRCRFRLYPATNTGRAGPWLRWTPGTGGYLLRINAGALELGLWTGTSLTTVLANSHSPSLTAGVESGEYVVEVEGNDIRVYDTDGTTLLYNVTDSTWTTGTRVGAYTHGDGGSPTNTTRMHLSYLSFESLDTGGAGTQDIAPSLLTNSQTHYTPAISVGNVDLTPTLHTNSQTFYAPVVDHATTTQDIEPALLTNTQTFWVPTMGVGATTISPTLHTNTQTFYGPAVTLDTVLEVATGKMLNARFGGSSYTDEWMYYSTDGTTFSHTYDDPQWGDVAHGKAISMRAVQAAFEHEGGTGYPAAFDPQDNTDAFCAALPDYVAAGVLNFVIGLQGGNPNYGNNGSDYEISAFEADGSLKGITGTDWTNPAAGSWMFRVKQIMTAIQDEGALCTLNLFYHGQDQVLTDNDAVRAACDNIVDFVVANGYRNVMYDIANEYDIGGSSPLGWQRTVLSTNSNAVITGASDQIAGLIIRIQQRYTVTHGLSWRAPVGVSTSLTTEFKDNLKKYADVCFPHGNGHDDWNGDDTYAAMIALRSSIDGGVNPGIPILMNEDANKESTTNGYVNDTNKAAELHALNDCMDADVSWGFMLEWIHQKYNMGLDTGWWTWSVGTAGVVQASRTEADYVADVLAGITAELEFTGQLLTPSLLTNTQTFYAPAISVGGVTVAPTLIPSTAEVFTPTFTLGGVSVAPTLLTNTSTVYTPAVAIGAGAINPSLLTNTQTFSAPSFTFGGVTVSPSRFTNAQTFYVPRVGEPQFARQYPITGSIPTQSITGSVPAYSVTGRSA